MISCIKKYIYIKTNLTLQVDITSHLNLELIVINHMKDPINQTSNGAHTSKTL